MLSPNVLLKPPPFCVQHREARFRIAELTNFHLRRDQEETWQAHDGSAQGERRNSVAWTRSFLQRFAWNGRKRSSSDSERNIEARKKGSWVSTQEAILIEAQPYFGTISFHGEQRFISEVNLAEFYGKTVKKKGMAAAGTWYTHMRQERGFEMITPNAAITECPSLEGRSQRAFSLWFFLSCLLEGEASRGSSYNRFRLEQYQRSEVCSHTMYVKEGPGFAEFMLPAWHIDLTASWWNNFRTCCSLR